MPRMLAVRCPFGDQFGRPDRQGNCRTQCFYWSADYEGCAQYPKTWRYGRGPSGQQVLFDRSIGRSHTAAVYGARKG